MVIDREITTEHARTSVSDDDGIVEMDSGLGYEPSCPVCGTTQTDLYEHNLNDGDTTEIECDSCESVLTLDCAWTVEYSLTWNRPTQEELQAKSDREERMRIEEIERRKRWETDRPRLEAESTRLALLRSKYPGWHAWTWDEWIPDELRESVERAQADDWGRGPASWMECARRSGAPEYGSWHTAGDGTCSEVRGRYVHRMNNMGQLVDDRGVVHVCSVHGGKVFLCGSRPGPEPPNEASTTMVDPKVEARR